MDPNTHTDAADALSWLGAANTGLGIVLMAAFPLAVPLLILTAVFVLPLLLLAVPVGLVLVVRRRRERGEQTMPSAPQWAGSTTTSRSDLRRPSLRPEVRSAASARR